jgi:hypothetical protein
MADQDRIHRCLNPVGITPPVELFPLAPRLATLEGKTIWLSITGEPDITTPLERRLKTSYPNVDWKIKKTYNFTPVPLTDEELETADGLIQAVSY